MPKRNETLKFSAAFQGTARTSAQTTIVDTSYPMTYTSKWATTAAGTTTITETGEGKDVYFVIGSDNVPDGTRGRVIVNATGTGIDGAVVADFNNYVYSTDVIINGGKAAVKVSIKADQLTENRESFYAALLDTEGGVLTSAHLYINDTSKTPAPTYKIGWYSNSTGTTPINTINEGSTAWLNVSGANIPNGTVVTVKLSGTGITTRDFTDNLIQKDIVIQNNTGRVSFSLTNDLTTEGAETIIGTAFVGSVNIGSTNLIINDTSVVQDVIVDTPIQSNETYQGTPFKVVKGINAYDYFIMKVGREPLPGESVRFIIPAGYSLTGYWPIQNAIIFDSRFNTVTSIKIENRGIMLGRGGGSVNAYSDGRTAFDCVVNQSTTPVNIDNYNIIAGGGGGQAGYYDRGQAGTPWGQGGTGSNQSTGWERHPHGLIVYHTPWGEAGRLAVRRPGGRAGYVAVGLVTITNHGNAWWKGHEGRLGTP